VPAGTSTFEWWYDQKLSLENTKNVRHRTLWEFEFGLGYRLQLDLYLRLQQEGWAGPIEINEEKVELRWALMDWGCLPGNPTLYVEFNRAHNEPSQLELKLLLGDEITRRLHWGVNFGIEHQLGGEYGNEYTAVGALSYTIVDSVFSAGLEVLFQPVDVQGDRFAWGKNYEFLAGPSLQWRPTKAMHIDLVLPFGYEIETAEGAKETTPLFHWTTVVGWEF